MLTVSVVEIDCFCVCVVTKEKNSPKYNRKQRNYKQCILTDLDKERDGQACTHGD